MPSIECLAGELPMFLPLCLVALLAAEHPLDAFDYADASAARQAWKASEGTPPVDVARDGDRRVLRFEAPFAAQPRVARAVLDRNVPLDLERYGEFRLELDIDRPAACTRWSLYFRSGNGWYSGAASIPLDLDEAPPEQQALNPAGLQRHTLTFAKSSFGVEGEPDGWNKIDGIRLSAWKTEAVDASIRLRRLTAIANDIAIVVPDGRAWEASGERRTAHDQAALMADMLGELGLGSTLLSESLLEKSLAHHRIAILGHNPGLSPTGEAALVRFAEQGGRVFACYTLSDRLARALGFGEGRYFKPDAPGHLAEIRFEQSATGLPKSARQSSWNIVDMKPIGHNARVCGEWYDEAGRPAGRAALLLSDRGAFFSHIVLSSDREAKQEMLAAIVGHLHGDLWRQTAAAALERAGQVGHCRNFDQWLDCVGPTSAGATSAVAKMEQARREFDGGQFATSFRLAKQVRALALAAYLAKVPSRAVEGRAVWNHSGTGAYAGDWNRSAKLLADNGFNMVLPNMLWGGLAHYASDLLPRSETFRRHGDQIEQCCAASKAHGLEVHVWKVNYNLSTAPKTFVDAMRKANRTQVTVKGEAEDWLCPSHPENQKLELETMLEVARKYPVDGLHFDYIRYPGRSNCYCDGCRQRFERDTQAKVADWPTDCHSGLRKDAYHDWRCQQITQLVESVSRDARRLRPGIKISAAVFGSYPDCRTSVGQDWPAWVRAGYLDFLCPMDYTPRDGEFRQLVSKQMKLVDGRIPLYPGIGATASRMALAPDRVVGQVEWARKLGAAGFTVFDFGPATAESFVPGVGLGAGSQKAVPPHRQERQ
jgi:uncharacterized lipoprotein YddW (UPF0748 family)